MAKALETLILNIEARTGKLESQLKSFEKKGASIKINIETQLLKKDFSQLQSMHDALTKKLAQKKSLNVDYGSVKKTKDALDQVNRAMDDYKMKGVNNVESASRWGMIATGIQSTVMSIRDAYQQIKQVINESINGAADLNVLRSSFKGNPEDLSLLSKAVSGTLSESKLIALSNRATDLKMSMTDQALAFSFAEDRADSYGGTVEENFNKIVNASEGMGRGLKEIGIETKVYEQNLKKLIKENGGKLEQLDAEQQKTIMLKAAIMSLGNNLDDVKAKQKDEKDLIESTNVSIEESRLKLGNFILQGLVPLLRKFDESGESIKGFITGVIAIGGTIIQTIPIIVQLITAKKLFALSSAQSAVSVSTETAAIVANTTTTAANTAAKSINMKMGLGLIGKVTIIAAVGVAVYELTQMINENTKSIKANRNEAEKRFPSKFNTGFGDPFNPEKNKPQTDETKANFADYYQFQNVKVISKIVTENKKTSLSVEDIRQKIEALTAANNSANISWEDYKKNLKEIAKLNLLLNGSATTTNNAKSKYFDLLKFEAADYYKYRLELINKEIAEMRAAGLSEIEAQRYKFIKLKELAKESSDYMLGKNLPTKPGDVPKTSSQIGSSTGPLSGVNKPSAVNPIKETTDELETQLTLAEGLKDAFADANNQLAQTGANAIQIFSQANSVLQQYIETIIRSIAQTIILAAVTKFITSPILGFLGLGTGGSITNQNGQPIKKAATGLSNFIVPYSSRFLNDRLPVMVGAGETVNVTSASATRRGISDERMNNSYMREMLNKMDVMNFHLIESSLKRTNGRIAVDVSGEIENNAIRLANKKATKTRGRFS